MRIKYHGSYKKYDEETRTLKTRFRYVVTGTKEELEKYESIKGEYHRTIPETGEPLFFNQNYLGQSCELKFNQDGTGVYPDTSELDIAKNLIAQNEGVLAQSLASVVAQHMLAGATGRVAQNTPVNTPVTPPEGKEGPQDLGNL